MKYLFTAAFVAASASAASADPWHHETFVVEPDDYIAASVAPGSFPAPFPAGIGLLSEPAIQNGLLLAAKVRDAQGVVVGFAAEQAELDFDDLVSHATWTVTIPGRGTLFLEQDEDVAPLFAILGDMIAHAEFERTYDPPLHLVTTVGEGTIVGGTGEFEDARGTFVEVDDVHFLSLATGALVVTDTLELTIKTKSD